MTRQEFIDLFLSASENKKMAVLEILLGEEGRPSYPLDKDSAIVMYGDTPLNDDELVKRLYRVAQWAKPAHLPKTDTFLLVCAGYQIGKADGKREERTKKGHRATIGTRHDDLNNNDTTKEA
jgi:hypothetical protein